MLGSATLVARHAHRFGEWQEDTGRRRDVLDQGARQGQLRRVPPGDARRRRRAFDAEVAAGGGAGAPGVRAALPAGRRAGDGRRRGSRGALAVAAPRTRAAPAGGLHRPGRGIGRHREHRQVGAGAGLSADPGVGDRARRRRAGAELQRGAPPAAARAGLRRRARRPRRVRRGARAADP